MPEKTYFLGLPWASDDTAEAEGAIVTITPEIARQLLGVIAQAQALARAERSFQQITYLANADGLGCTPTFVWLDNLKGLSPAEREELDKDVSCSDEWRELDEHVAIDYDGLPDSTDLLLRVTADHVLWQALIGRVVVETATLTKAELAVVANSRPA